MDLLDLAVKTANRIISWATWYVRLYVPGLKPAKQSTWPPQWYRYSYQWWVWENHLDSDNRPTFAFCKYYIRAVWNYFLHKVRQEWEDAIASVLSVIRGALGTLSHGYSTFHDWIEGIYRKVGTGVLTWADNLLQAADRLYRWLPEGIRQGLNDWLDFFVYWYGQAKIWVSTTYASVFQNAIDAWNWVVATGEAIKAWYNTVRVWVLDWAQNARERILGLLGAPWRWLTALVADPYGVIGIILGTAWTRLKSWSAGPLDFYYNLWGAHWREIGEFWADPLGWLYDRVEDELVRRW